MCEVAGVCASRLGLTYCMGICNIEREIRAAFEYHPIKGLDIMAKYFSLDKTYDCGTQGCCRTDEHIGCFETKPTLPQLAVAMGVAFPSNGYAITSGMVHVWEGKTGMVNGAEYTLSELSFPMSDTYEKGQVRKLMVKYMREAFDIGISQKPMKHLTARELLTKLPGSHKLRRGYFTAILKAYKAGLFAREMGDL